MTSREYLDELFRMEEHINPATPCSEETAYELAQLVSGSFVAVLVEELWLEFHDLERITVHLEKLSEDGQHYGLVYLTYVLANSVDLVMPLLFAEVSSREDLIKPLAEAILEDWLDCIGNYEERELPLS